MALHRCPRCRAEDISADAHPTRVLDNGVERPVFVCRNCYRAAELEFRIASQTADLGYGCRYTTWARDLILRARNGCRDGRAIFACALRLVEGGIRGTE